MSFRSDLHTYPSVLQTSEKIVCRDFVETGMLCLRSMIELTTITNFLQLSVHQMFQNDPDNCFDDFMFCHTVASEMPSEPAISVGTA